MAKNQQELTQVAQTELDKKIEVLVEEYEVLSVQKEKVGNLKEELMPMMKKAKRWEIKSGGFKIRYREGEDGITISKEPNKE